MDHSPDIKIPQEADNKTVDIVEEATDEATAVATWVADNKRRYQDLDVEDVASNHSGCHIPATTLEHRIRTSSLVQITGGVLISNKRKMHHT